MRPMRATGRRPSAWPRPRPVADLARAHLLHGEWLRRREAPSRGPRPARAPRTPVHRHGRRRFAERARSSSRATGEQARRRSVETATDLTPQEDQIARLAAVGDTNAEIAERLYISSRTVDYHLRKVYRKLGIGSRRDLRGRFA